MPMCVRKSRFEDFDSILGAYQYAREEMRRMGNPQQWGTSYPPPELVRHDIETGTSYVITDDGEIVAVFVFLVGEDPTYQQIEDGSWQNSEPYGVIHRLAGNGRRTGVFDCCCSFCEAQIPNIRVDTHSCNKKMQHLLERRGYVRCGRIYVADGSPRIAYQKSGANRLTSRFA